MLKRLYKFFIKFGYIVGDDLIENVDSSVDIQEVILLNIEDIYRYIKMFFIIYKKISQ